MYLVTKSPEGFQICGYHMNKKYAKLDKPKKSEMKAKLDLSRL